MFLISRSGAKDANLYKNAAAVYAVRLMSPPEKHRTGAMSPQGPRVFMPWSSIPPKRIFYKIHFDFLTKFDSFFV